MTTISRKPTTLFRIRHQVIFGAWSSWYCSHMTLHWGNATKLTAVKVKFCSVLTETSPCTMCSTDSLPQLVSFLDTISFKFSIIALNHQSRTDHRGGGNFSNPYGSTSDILTNFSFNPLSALTSNKYCVFYLCGLLKLTLYTWKTIGMYVNM